MRRLCAASPTLAQHAEYLFWLTATLYRRASLVAVEPDGRLVGYLLSLPGAGLGAEFILQLAVDPARQRRGIGLGLLREHWRLAMALGVERVATSISADCTAGIALMKSAIRVGFPYRSIPWPGDAYDGLADREILYEATVTGLL
jgi:ribosomal protein S18 acetylase RimI-like enzyme